MFRKRYHQQIPELNTTSTADISFMLLIFFLVTSSMDTEKGMLRQMAPPPLEHEKPKDINRDHVMQVRLDAKNQLSCDGIIVNYEQLVDEIRSMITINRTGHVISIQADSHTTYEAYFRMQDAVVGAYHTVRNEYALKHFGHVYEACSTNEREAINDYYPMRISESPIDSGDKFEVNTSTKKGGER